MKGKDLNPDVISEPGATISSGWSGGGGGGEQACFHSVLQLRSVQEGIIWTVTSRSDVCCHCRVPQRHSFVHGINEEWSKEHMGFSKFLLPYYTKVSIFVAQPTGSCVSTYSSR